MEFTCIPQLGESGGGKVWDPKENKVLAIFDENGRCETEDKHVIAMLKAMGFKEASDPVKKTVKKPVKRGMAIAGSGKKTAAKPEDAPAETETGSTEEAAGPPGE